MLSTLGGGTFGGLTTFRIYKQPQNFDITLGGGGSLLSEVYSIRITLNKTGLLLLGFQYKCALWFFKVTTKMVT